jgi:hypothetical protein
MTSSQLPKVLSAVVLAPSALLVFSLATPVGAVAILIENFDNETQFLKADVDSAAVFFNDSTQTTETYWGIFDPGAGPGDFDMDPEPTGVPAYAGGGLNGNHVVGGFLTGGPNTPLPVRLDWSSNLPITGLTNLTFRGSFAAEAATGQAFESSNPAGTQGDFIRVQYQIDGGGFMPLLYFSGNANGQMALDTDLDGVGDGTVLTRNGQSFIAAIAGRGSDLDLRVVMWTTAVGEEFAFDTLAIQDLSGDYNGNGVVDAADYVVWQNTFGQNGARLAADGNGNNVVDAADYDVWRSQFGRTLSSSAAPVALPEPMTSLVTTIGFVFLIGIRSRIGTGGGRQPQQAPATWDCAFKC